MLAAGGEGLLLMDVTPAHAVHRDGRRRGHPPDRAQLHHPHPFFQDIHGPAAPFQSTVEIKVLQGEREFAKDNKLLGTFTLRGIKRAWAGVPQIEVTFDIDANGIVTVSARDLETGKQQSITITGTSNLSEEEIQRAMRDAAAYASQDAEKKAAVEALTRRRKHDVPRQYGTGQQGGQSAGPRAQKPHQGSRARAGKTGAPQKAGKDDAGGHQDPCRRGAKRSNPSPRPCSPPGRPSSAARQTRNIHISRHSSAGPPRAKGALSKRTARLLR